MKRYLQEFAFALLALFLIVTDAPASAAAANTCVADPKIWEDSIDRETEERFIPVELWTGTPWNGNRNLDMPTVDSLFNHLDTPEQHYRIEGPVEYTHRDDKQTYKVYVRTNPVDNDGQPNRESKVQKFTINDKRSGLGRLYDSRENRSFTGGLKFPLGPWKKNRVRSFDLVQTELKESTDKSKKETIKKDRKETIKITKLDFDFAGNRHCLEFEWKKETKNNTCIDHRTYLYCPCKSMLLTTDLTLLC